MFFLATVFSSSFLFPASLLVSARLMGAQKNLLKTLLYLELISLLMLSSLSCANFTLFPNHLFIFFLFVYMVCEAALGLGVMVNFSRSNGSLTPNF